MTGFIEPSNDDRFDPRAASDLDVDTITFTNVGRNKDETRTLYPHLEIAHWQREVQLSAAARLP